MEENNCGSNVGKKKQKQRYNWPEDWCFCWSNCRNNYTNNPTPSCDQIVPVFDQVLKMLLLSCCQAVSYNESATVIGGVGDMAEQWSDSDPIKISLGGTCAASQVKKGNEVGIWEEEEEKGPRVQLALYLRCIDVFEHNSRTMKLTQSKICSHWHSLFPPIS